MGASLGWAVSDTWALARRNLLRYLRVPGIFVAGLVQPIMFFVLFLFVFGGAIIGSTDNYIDFLLPGIIVQTVMFGTVGTAIGLADDLTKGVIQRYKSLPMSRSAVIAGRIMADTLYNVVVVALMFLVGFIFGFRFHAEPLTAALVPVAALLFGVPFSWVAAYIGVSFREPEAVQMVGFTWMFPVTFVSSAFVPVETMPSWLQPVAEANPFSLAVNGIRALSLGQPVGNDLWIALIWGVGITAVFAPLAIAKYRKST